MTNSVKIVTGPEDKKANRLVDSGPEQENTGKILKVIMVKEKYQILILLNI